MNIRGVMVSALDFCPGDRGSIPRQVEMFINLKFSFRMRPWESRGPTAPVGPHPLCVKCCVRYYLSNIHKLSSPASIAVL